MMYHNKGNIVCKYYKDRKTIYLQMELNRTALFMNFYYINYKTVYCLLYKKKKT